MVKEKFPIVILLSGYGSTLQAIIDSISNQTLNAKIEAVISNRSEAYGLKRAQQAGIKTHILSPKSYNAIPEYEQDLIKLIDEYQPKLLILAGFMRILSPEFVKHYQGKIINIHPSLLPKYRGLHTHQQVLANKDQEHGTTVHFVTDELDAGPVIAQAKFDVKEDDTEESLIERIHTLEHQLYPQIIQLLLQGKIRLEGAKVYLDSTLLPDKGLNFS